jgi:hypothetical protein
VDEELEKVVEFVGEGVNGARLGLRRGEGEGEREVGLVAGCEGNVLEVAETVCDLYWARELVMDGGGELRSNWLRSRRLH